MTRTGGFAPFRPSSARLLVLLVATALAVPAGARAQWVEEPGTGWVQLTLFHLDTTEEFGTPRDPDVEEIFADGHIVSTSLFVTAAVGLLPGVDARAQLPVHRLEFDDAAGERRETGLGDPKLWLRVGPEALGLRLPGPLRVALRGGVKLVGSEFPVDAEVIPLTEGQRDWELLAEVGASFWPAPVYAYGWFGHRWRERNDAVLRDPGDELFAFLAAGGELGRLSWQVAWEGMWGGAWEIEGIRTSSARRRISQLLPKVGWPAGPGRVELGGRIPLDGLNLPAGPAVTAGYFVDWAL